MGCTHAGFRKAFIMAFGMRPLDRNTTSLGTLIRRVGCCDVKLQNPSLYGPHISLRMEHLDEVNSYLSDSTSPDKHRIDSNLQRDIIALADEMEKFSINDETLFT
ncbi:hypothetical protein CPB85DRAFT_1440830 [Mucidula mucida]|nr:hypothetical protein CPB85DRAFT_1440830 [Mucidula mucida]